MGGNHKIDKRGIELQAVIMIKYTSQTHIAENGALLIRYQLLSDRSQPHISDEVLNFAYYIHNLTLILTAQRNILFQRLPERI